MSLKSLTTEQRILAPQHHIDPGFINHRLIFSTFGPKFIEFFNRQRRPGDDHLTVVSNDHLLVDMALRVSAKSGVLSLGELIEDPHKGMLFCSTEKIEGNKEVYHADHVREKIILPYEYDRDIFLEFHTKHIVADTGRLELSQESVVSLLAGIHSISDQEIVARPLIIGAPSYDHPENRDLGVDIFWYGWDWYEIYAEDIEEFKLIRGIEPPSPDEWMNIMEHLSENEVKTKFCEILGEIPKKDWGGELDDHFSASLHLGEERVTAAFLLKGPARFREMTPDLLGSRADQIFRLTQTPAKLLIVQHCHQIGEAVRATLRAFAVTPHNPRRYCLIDGRDTYLILQAYNKI